MGDELTALITKFDLSTPVNCSDPTVPVNGSIEEYQNTTEGAEIVFGCDLGHSPAGQMRATCASDGRWNPDPATLMCICEWKSNRDVKTCLNHA